MRFTAAPAADREVLDAEEISGRRAAAGAELNEHPWYDLASVDKPATRMTDELAERDPAGAGIFRSNARSGDVKALVYNAQTAGPQTEQLRSAAQDDGVAIVEVTETLPAGTTYLDWMSSNLDAMRDALEARWSR